MVCSGAFHVVSWGDSWNGTKVDSTWIRNYYAWNGDDSDFCRFSRGFDNTQVGCAWDYCPVFDHAVDWVGRRLNFSLPAQFKLGIILVSCCPGGTASNVVTYLARGNLALSVMMTMCSTLLAIGLTPLLTKTYASAILEVDAWSMVVSMVMIVLLPIIIGLVLNSLVGERLEAIKKGSPLISVFVIVLIVAAVVGATKSNIQAHWETLLPAVFIVHALDSLWDIFGGGFLV